MGRRKAKSGSDLRRGSSKKSGDLVLIVCEGEKTEPNYLREYLADLGISKKKAEIEVTGECGSDPLSVVNLAINKFQFKNYDHIFCVIDRDKHPNFDDALTQLKSHKWTNGRKDEKFKATTHKTIVSIPCFEYWLLLHYKDTTKAFHGNAQGVSACKECIKELKIFITEYEKGSCEIYSITKSRIEDAISRSKSIVSRKTQEHQNPITYFHELVEFLKSFS
jgi:hypothetical protein